MINLGHQMERFLYLILLRISRTYAFGKEPIESIWKEEGIDKPLVPHNKGDQYNCFYCCHKLASWRLPFARLVLHRRNMTSSHYALTF